MRMIPENRYVLGGHLKFQFNFLIHGCVVHMKCFLA
jgi:hypothetical protein